MKAFSFASLVLVFASGLYTQATTPSELGLPNINTGSEILEACTSFLHPWQEGGEEADTPALVPAVFRSIPPYYSRAERVAMGHKGVSVANFSKDLSQVNIAVQIAGINTSGRISSGLDSSFLTS